MRDSKEYKLIQKFYGDQVAQRSRVPMINHINEGLTVLQRIGASEYAQRAFCIHPMVQADLDLVNNYDILVGCEAHIIALAIEYRSVANEYLSDKVGSVDSVRLSPLEEVNQMLIADKVQNRKDFLTYHKDTHPRSKLLDEYFKEWMEALEIDHELYDELCAAINNSKVTAMTREQELEEKVEVYESLLHHMQLLAFTGNNELMQRTIEQISRWSHAHRSGNGELSEEEENERIQYQYNKLKELVGK